MNTTTAVEQIGEIPHEVLIKMTRAENAMDAPELLRQIHPEVLSEPNRTEDNSLVINCRPVTGMIIGCVCGFGLWVGIILLLLSTF